MKIVKICTEIFLYFLLTWKKIKLIMLINLVSRTLRKSNVEVYPNVLFSISPCINRI